MARPEDAWRVVDTRTNRTLRWRDLVGRLSTHHAVFVGEFHDDPQTHLAELLLLQGIHGKVGSRLTLAMEMFERDQQAPLDDYLAGRITEETLGKAIKLWGNYATDYRPMVEFAKEKRIPVVGSNAPQKYVRLVGREGVGKLATLPDAEKPHIAAYVNAPEGDEYARRFTQTMTGSGGMGAHGAMTPEMLRRIYEAQCLRDDTMGETCARLVQANRIVLHLNGCFHSDAGLGTAARFRWRVPLGTTLAVVKVLPVKDPVGKVPLDPYRAEADYLILVPDYRSPK
jgi:uncharacterized iron-regulated protein